MPGNTDSYFAWVSPFLLGMGALAAPVFAGEDRVDIDRVPKVVRHEIEAATRDASHIVVIRVSDDSRPEEDYFARYVDGAGREMKLRLTPGGRVLERGPTREQRHKDELARIQEARNEAERARLREELAAQREREDHEQYEAFRASQEHAEHAGHWGVTLKELSEEYNSTDRRRVGDDDLPRGVRRTFDSETIGTSDVDYYQYTVDGRQFYSAHYNTGAERRMVCRVDEHGKLLGKNELLAVAAAPLPVEQHAVSLTFEELPRAIRETMRRETRDGRDLAFYRITRGNDVFFTVHYTTDSNRRLDLWLGADGQLVSRNPTAIQPGDRNYQRDELGR